MTEQPGYHGRLLRVDLTRRQISVETLAPDILRQYLGGTGLGVSLLYAEVPPEVGWDNPENRDAHDSTTRQPRDDPGHHGTTMEQPRDQVA